MSGENMILLGLQSVVFVAWAFVMFRTLFAQKRRATMRTGKALPGPLEALREWGIWWRNPRMQAERRLLIGLTLCLIVLIGASSTMMAAT